MNIRTLKQLGIAAALLGTMISATVANAAIVAGSSAQITGTSSVSSTGVITTVGPTYLNFGGNTGSFAGYDFPNPGAPLPLYTAGMATLDPAALGFTLLSLPEVSLILGEPGPVVPATFFRLDTWSAGTALRDGVLFYVGTGTGAISDGQGNQLADGVFSFSTQNFAFDQALSFSGTLTAASVVPVPGAMWIFGSGLLLMSAVMRRKPR
jgi:hypothetical protein